MHYRTTKMDGRYSKHGYEYLIEFVKSSRTGTGVLEFDRARRWFNATFGWSQDVETRDTMLRNQERHPNAYQPDDINPVWAYCVKYGDYRIYVDNDKTLGWFILCHPKSQ